MFLARNCLLAGMTTFALVLTGCNDRPESSRVNKHGRFTGIAVFEAGRLWPQVAAAGGPTARGIASPADDEHIIVVVDTTTGEVRQCGDLSGRCIGMNPWGSLGAGATAPVKVGKHLSELDQPETMSANDAAPAR
jgi:hypothetical protein